jgi:hypothetical protein
MSRRGKIVVIVCIAVFAFTAIVATPMFALLDAQTAIDALFWTPAAAPAPRIEGDLLPTFPAVDVQSPRAPPRA